MLPQQIVGGAIENGGLEPVGSLEFEIEQRALGAQAVLVFGRKEDQVARTDVADAGQTLLEIARERGIAEVVELLDSRS